MLVLHSFLESQLVQQQSGLSAEELGRLVLPHDYLETFLCLGLKAALLNELHDPLITLFDGVDHTLVDLKQFFEEQGLAICDLLESFLEGCQLHSFAQLMAILTSLTLLVATTEAGIFTGLEHTD